MPEGERSLSRRELFKITALSLASLGVNRSHQFAPPPSSYPEKSINVNPRAIGWYELNRGETLDRLYDMPLDRARISIPFDQVVKEIRDETVVCDFKITDEVVDSTLRRGLGIDLNLGYETFGYPEFHPTIEILKRFPYLDERNIKVDREEGFRQIILNFLEQSAKHYLPIKQIRTIQVDNELCSRRLSVKKGKFISTEFNEIEKALVRDNDPYHRPFLQNLPIDTPELILYVLKNHDEIGINHYYQIGVPGELMWFLTSSAIAVARSFNKVAHILEFQVAPWLNQDKEPAFPYSTQSTVRGYERAKQLPIQSLAVWDQEQLHWRVKRGEEEYQEVLELLAF